MIEVNTVVFLIIWVRLILFDSKLAVVVLQKK